MSSNKRKSNTKYITKYITEFDLQNYLNNSNNVNILVSTSYCSQTMTGVCKCLLLYKGAYKLVKEEMYYKLFNKLTDILENIIWEVPLYLLW